MLKQYDFIRNISKCVEDHLKDDRIEINTIYSAEYIVLSVKLTNNTGYSILDNRCGCEISFNDKSILIRRKYEPFYLNFNMVSLVVNYYDPNMLGLIKEHVQYLNSL